MKGVESKEKGDIKLNPQGTNIESDDVPITSSRFLEILWNKETNKVIKEDKIFNTEVELSGKQYDQITTFTR
ncbi:hypothetical protein PCANC_14226 [Puccinia coronata f. sp. avenae]|uniref:Uncharacterized protein n=1 Tax=Puccinia coronata f. sp. avenae TaxID=200324 RepID=A0A2N5UQK4_9BASI|nr:hypothetical protein PCANC_14226 [Puccinia coronata f. sp. avenae]